MQITITQEQASVMSKACQLFSQIHTGALNEIADLINLYDDDDRDEFRQGLSDLEPYITGKPRGISFDINSDKVSKEAQIAYRCLQMLNDQATSESG